MRATWQHLRANPVQAIVMWLVNFVVVGVVNAAVRAALNDPLEFVAVLLWAAWLATIETFVMTWYTLRQRAKAAAVSAE